MTLIWDERFEAAPGFDETWSIGELIGTGPSMDENATPPSAATNEWGSECYEIVGVGGENSILFHDFAANEAISFSRHEVVVTAESLANSERFWLCATQTAGGSETMWRCELHQSGSGQLFIRFVIRHDDSDNNFDFNISLDELHTIEVSWNSTADTWEFWFDGVSQSSGTLTNAAAGWEMRRILLGSLGVVTDAAFTVFFDLVAYDDSQRVELLATPAPAEGSLITIDPSIVLGSTTATPAAAASSLVTIDPTVVLASMNITPAASSAAFSSVGPTVILGGMVINPVAADGSFIGLGPVVVLGSVTVVPTRVAGVFRTVGPVSLVPGNFGITFITDITNIHNIS